MVHLYFDMVGPSKLSAQMFSCLLDLPQLSLYLQKFSSYHFISVKNLSPRPMFLYASSRISSRFSCGISVYSLLDPRHKELSVNLVKKLCDGLEMTMGQFFSAKVFDDLDQEIQ